MTSPEARPQQGSPAARGALMRTASLEATLPSQSELAELAEVLPKATPIYLSAPPGHAHLRLAQVAKHVRDAGFEPVPHVAARGFPDRATLNDFIARVAGEAAVDRVLVIAGDVDRPAGPFAGANAVIASDLLQRHGIREVGISGYPDGHPKLSDDTLHRAMTEKLASAQARGLQVRIVSQFCFDGEAIAAWLESLRAAGIRVPIQVGVAGPSSAKGLARFALRCGVRASFKAMLSGKATQLLADVTPDDLIARVETFVESRALDGVSAHIYSFGGLVRTARWLRARGSMVGLPTPTCP
jgi:methylenetetrahydrofolate reductase (NADPH)